LKLYSKFRLTSWISSFQAWFFFWTFLDVLHLARTQIKLKWLLKLLILFDKIRAGFIFFFGCADLRWYLLLWGGRERRRLVGSFSLHFLLKELLFIAFEGFILMIYLVEFVDHLVKILEVVWGVLLPRFVWFDFTKL